MTLADWQNRLHEHFEALHRQRSSAVGDKPVFALEHGLTSAEINDLAALVRAHVRRAVPDDRCFLPWVVYAAEVGYRYSGDEYWQTFEEETQGWKTHGDRYWIRDHCFHNFHRKYGGARPSGPWAGRFTIICWPITNAILPKDLQRQLARILFELRHSFSAELFESPAKLGEFIAARSWTATSRFQELTEEPQLIGQIATALLLQGALGTGNLIFPATLRRIGEDLDREQRAREWLRTAQRFARERAHIRGLAFGRASTRSIARPEQARAEIAALGIEPRLVLRPTNPSGFRWDVSLEVPELSNLLFRFPAVRETLTGSRCIVAGASGRPLARERCLHGSQRVTLERWPDPGEVLLKFERADPQLDYLLRTECLLRPGPNWLFRISSDGFAYELRSLRVRAGERYVLVTTAGSLSPGDHVSPLELACHGISGVLIEVPAAIDVDLEDRIRRLGLAPARTIELWPAGLAAVTWDGEGHGEWLASERPCLGIRSDHAIGSLVISMNGGPQLPVELKSVKPGQTVFVELPQLPVGLHKVHVSTRDELGQVEPLGDLDVVMRIREARPWSPAATHSGPFFVDVDPPNPTLEQLWEGQVEISIRGPAGRQVRCRTSLCEKDGDSPLATIDLPALTLPVDPDEWSLRFQQHFRRKPQVQRAYDAARTSTLEFSAEELGAFSLRCQREFTPVRWVLRHAGNQSVVRLIDDTGVAGIPVVSRYSFELPTVAERLESGDSFAVPPSGGLYVCQRGEFTAALIVSPVAVRTFADLKGVPSIRGFQRTTDGVLRLMFAFKLWARARLSGDLVSVLRQNTVLRSVVTEIYRLIGGNTWIRAESSVASSGHTLPALIQFVSQRREDLGYLRALESEWDSLVKANLNDRIQRLTLLAQRWKLATAGIPRLGGAASPTTGPNDDLKGLIELSLRLASDPSTLNAGDKAVQMQIVRLLDTPTIARTARLLVLYTDRQRASSVVPGCAYPGWSWS